MLKLIKEVIFLCCLITVLTAKSGPELPSGWLNTQNNGTHDPNACPGN